MLMENPDTAGRAYIAFYGNGLEANQPYLFTDVS